jgi:hypothetical protein
VVGLPACPVVAILNVIDLISCSVDNCAAKSEEEKYGTPGFGLWRRGCEFCR